MSLSIILERLYFDDGGSYELQPTESIPVRFFVPSPKASLYPVSSLHHLNTTSVYSVDQEITGEAISKPKYTGNTINNRLQPDYTTSVSSKNTICNILLQRTCSTDFGEDFWKYNMGTVSVDWRCCTTTRDFTTEGQTAKQESKGAATQDRSTEIKTRASADGARRQGAEHQ
jgi:hypothetical protein